MVHFIYLILFRLFVLYYCVFYCSELYCILECICWSQVPDVTLGTDYWRCDLPQ